MANPLSNIQGNYTCHFDHSYPAPDPSSLQQVTQDADGNFQMAEEGFPEDAINLDYRGSWNDKFAAGAKKGHTFTYQSLSPTSQNSGIVSFTAGAMTIMTQGFSKYGPYQSLQQCTKESDTAPANTPVDNPDGDGGYGVG